ncbi:hypothetical protein GC56T3_0593 [Geobacillus sp. C56-T3]|nr:hypothetical protein GC56T3_0593 [Geobacillus sp. C56-T3]
MKPKKRWARFSSFATNKPNDSDHAKDGKKLETDQAIFYTKTGAVIRAKSVMRV